MMLSIYAVSTQYVEVPISNDNGINPTSDVVQFAFLGPYNTVPIANTAVPTSSTTYYTGLWPSMSPVSNMPNTYNAAILVGPNGGAVTLTTGSYLVVVKVTDNPEVPIIFSGPMVVA